MVRPILLALYKNFDEKLISEKDLLRHLKNLHDFHSIYTAISKRPTNTLENIYNQHSTILYNSYSKSTFNNMMNDLEKVLPSYTDFEREFISKKYSNKSKDYSTHRRAIKHILFSVENYLLKSDELGINRYSMEHIKGDEGDDITSSVGNLIPLAKKLNENAENFELDKKVPFYKKSKFETVKLFLKNHGNRNKWTSENIDIRAKKLSKLCYTKIWNL